MMHYAAEGPAETLSRIMSERQSSRAFLDEELEKTTIVELLEMAQHAPSWCNVQPWEVIVVTGSRLESMRHGLKEHAENGTETSDLAFPSSYEGIYRDRRRECGWQLYESVGVARGDRTASRAQAMENFRFFGAPALLIITSEAALGPYAVLDCGVYLGHLLLAAEALGIAAIAQASIAAHSDYLRAALEIPQGRQVVVGVAIGYSDRQHPSARFRTNRAPLEQVVTFLS